MNYGLLYLHDLILFSGLFQGNAISELGRCCNIYVKMPDVLTYGNSDLGSFFPLCFYQSSSLGCGIICPS